MSIPLERLGHSSRPVTPDEAKQIVSLYVRGRSLKSLQKEFHRGKGTILQLLRSNGVKLRLRRRADEINYCPTAGEIQRKTAEIKEGWTEEDHRIRAGVVESPYTVPECLPKARRNGHSIFATGYRGV